MLKIFGDLEKYICFCVYQHLLSRQMDRVAGSNHLLRCWQISVKIDILNTTLRLYSYFKIASSFEEEHKYSLDRIDTLQLSIKSLPKCKPPLLH